MERIFQIAAVVLAGVSVYFLFQRNADGAFISAVFGAVSFFLSVRSQVKARNQKREAEAAAALDAEAVPLNDAEDGGA